MKNPYKIYKKSQDLQYNWIRNHPVQYVVLNMTLLAMLAGYAYYEDRKFRRKMEKSYDELESKVKDLNQR